MSDMNKFLTSPPPKGKMVQCTIVRDKSSFAKKMSPKYHVYLSVRIFSGSNLTSSSIMRIAI